MCIRSLKALLINIEIKEIFAVNTLWKLKTTLSWVSWEGICSVGNTPRFLLSYSIIVFGKGRGSSTLLSSFWTVVFWDWEEISQRRLAGMTGDLGFLQAGFWAWNTFTATCISDGMCSDVKLRPLLNISNWLSKRLIPHHCSILWVLNLN